MQRSRVLGLLAGALPALGRPTRVAAQAPPERIRVVGAPAENTTDLYYGIKAGVFARAGLEVEFVASNSGAAATAAVVAGTYEIAETSLLALFSAYVREIPIALIAPQVLSETANPRSFLVVPSDATTKTGGDLNGKTIGSPSLNDLGSLVTKAWVDKTGGNWRSLKFVEVPNSALEPALVAHRIDGAVLQTPQLDTSLAAGTSKALTYPHAAIAPIFMYTGYVARRDWLAQHADAAHRFVAALARSAAYVNAHRPETATVVAEYTKAPIATIEKMHRSTYALTIDPALIQPLIDAAAKYEQIPRPFPARDLLW